MKDKIVAIIKEIKEACKETELANVTHDEILSDAIVIYVNTRTFVAEAQDIAGQQQQPAGTENQELASEKQKAFAKQLGYKNNMDNLTKREASAIINELKNKQK